jgi:hypothetical protein
LPSGNASCIQHLDRGARQLAHERRIVEHQRQRTVRLQDAQVVLECLTRVQVVLRQCVFLEITRQRLCQQRDQQIVALRRSAYELPPLGVMHLHTRLAVDVAVEIARLRHNIQHARIDFNRIDGPRPHA